MRFLVDSQVSYLFIFFFAKTFFPASFYSVKTCFFYTFSELIFFSCQLLTVAELPGTPWPGLREPGRASSSPASPKKLQGTHNDCRATTTNLVFPIKDRHRYFWKCSLSWWIGWSVGHYFLKGLEATLLCTLYFIQIKNSALFYKEDPRKTEFCR